MKTRNKLYQFTLLIALLSGCNSGGTNHTNQPTDIAKQSSSESSDSLSFVQTTTPVIYDEYYLKSVIWKPLVAADKADPGNGEFAPNGTPYSSFFKLLSPPPYQGDATIGLLTSFASGRYSTGIPLYGYDQYSWQGCSEWNDYDFRANDPNLAPIFAIPNNDMKLHVTPLFAGQSTLTNPTDLNLNLTSAQFSYAQSTTNSTATTLGWKVGAAVKTTSKVDLVLAIQEVEVSVSAEINGSTTNTVSTTDTYTYTAPAQTILVPPHTTAIVSATLGLGTATGTYTTYSQLNSDGNIYWTNTVRCPDSKYNSDALWSFDLKRAYQLAPNPFRDVVGLVESNNNVYLSGSGSYSVEKAANFQIKVEFVPVTGGVNLQGAKQNKVITYTVPAIITKKI